MKGYVWTGDRWARFTEDPGGGGLVLAPTGWHASRRTAVPLPSTELEPSPWVEFVAETDEPTTWLDIALAYGFHNRDAVVEVGIGPAGSETPIGQWSATGRLGATNSETQVVSMPIPEIPAGSRVAARIWSTRVDATAPIRVSLGQSPHVPDTLYRWGLNEATGESEIDVLADFGGGAWVEIAASAPTGLVALHVRTTSESEGDRTTALEFGAGPPGAEVPFEPQILVFSSSTPAYVRYQSQLLIPAAIPAGTRITARSYRLSTSPATLGLVIHGVPA